MPAYTPVRNHVQVFWFSLHYRKRWDTEQLQLFVEQER